jgi:hypothetical protein
MDKIMEQAILGFSLGVFSVINAYVGHSILWSRELKSIRSLKCNEQCFWSALGVIIVIFPISLSIYELSKNYKAIIFYSLIWLIPISEAFGHKKFNNIV